MRFFWGLVGAIIGFLIIWKAFPLVQWFGKIPWAEKNLRSTYSLYKLVGLIIIILSLMYMFSLIDVLVSPFANIFGGLNPQ